MHRQHLPFLGLVGLLLVAPATAGGRESAPPAAAAAPAREGHVDLAVCLDTSNSMDGLINAARTKLWDVVNTLATARPRPILRVALYEYGNARLEGETGWVRRVLGLTDDLDTVYKELMALRTSGGEEYVARVVTRAAADLDWSADKRALKIIVVAGNEPATQDPRIRHVDAAKQAITAGIVVNTIFCGPHAEGVQTGWAEVARAADGRYASIEQDRTFTVATPVDGKLIALGAELNQTYVPYGAAGREGAANQVAQDRNAAAVAPAAGAQRAVAKGSALYTNARWDLVDAAQDEAFKLEDVPEADLPEELRDMTPAERRGHLDRLRGRRMRLQEEIRELAKEQRRFIEAERARQADTADAGLDTALVAALTEQAAAKGFTFDRPEPAAAR